MPRKSGVRVSADRATQIWVSSSHYLFGICSSGSANQPTGLEPIFPDAHFKVLGPPTLEQHAAIGKQRDKDDQFWQLMARTMDPSVRKEVRCFAQQHIASDEAWTPAVRAFLRSLEQERIDQLYEIVTELDSAMNDTSVNLLITLGKEKLLFSGDAQVEAWEFVLNQQALRTELQDVTLYKVGHHGSRNATPKSLWDLFKRRNKKKVPGRLVTVLSTESWYHGHSEDHTEVPRTTLVEALDDESELHDLPFTGGPMAEEIELEM